jgi:hypothetical protein
MLKLLYIASEIRTLTISKLLTHIKVTFHTELVG